MSMHMSDMGTRPAIAAHSQTLSLLTCHISVYAHEYFQIDRALDYVGPGPLGDSIVQYLCSLLATCFAELEKVIAEDHTVSVNEDKKERVAILGRLVSACDSYEDKGCCNTDHDSLQMQDMILKCLKTVFHPCKLSIVSVGLPARLMLSH